MQSNPLHTSSTIRKRSGFGNSQLCPAPDWKVKSRLEQTNTQIPVVLVYCASCMVAEQQKNQIGRMPCHFTMTKVLQIIKSLKPFALTWVATCTHVVVCVPGVCNCVCFPCFCFLAFVVLDSFISLPCHGIPAVSKASRTRGTCDSNWIHFITDAFKEILLESIITPEMFYNGKSLGEKQFVHLSLPFCQS